MGQDNQQTQLGRRVSLSDKKKEILFDGFLLWGTGIGEKAGELKKGQPGASKGV